MLIHPVKISVKGFAISSKLFSAHCVDLKIFGVHPQNPKFHEPCKYLFLLNLCTKN